MWLRELQRSRKGGIIKHVREETEKTLQYQIQCKAKYTSVFHYNHTPNTTFPLCLNYLSFLIKIDSPFLTCSFHLPYFSFQQKNNLAALPTGSNENCQHMMLIFLRSTLLHQRFQVLSVSCWCFLWWIMVAANYRANGHSLQLPSIQHHQPWHAINVHGEVPPGNWGSNNVPKLTASDSEEALASTHCCLFSFLVWIIAALVSLWISYKDVTQFVTRWARDNSSPQQIRVRLFQLASRIFMVLIHSCASSFDTTKQSLTENK